VRQGDVFWIDLERPRGSEPGFRRPVLVVQNNLLNESRIRTVVVCVITSNLRRAQAPGNVLLRTGEANLPKASVVNVSQIYTVDRSLLGEPIGTLDPERMEEVVEEWSSRSISSPDPCCRWWMASLAGDFGCLRQPPGATQSSSLKSIPNLRKDILTRNSFDVSSSQLSQAPPGLLNPFHLVPQRGLHQAAV
jgi:mRNA interferase MazF